jgi:putative ABC transport system ATP-binding protein
MNPAIMVRNVTKTYAEGDLRVPVLHGVDLEIQDGEIAMLVGPSGSGKTTLLSIMGCILKATSGSVAIGGQEVSGLSESQLPQVRLENIGFVFQGFNLFPTLTAGENVELMLRLKGASKTVAHNRAQELLKQVGLADKFDVVPTNLSGGQKQRVAIARALAGDPRIILADEPTAALDWQSGRAVMEMLRGLAHEQGRAVVIVTHDPRVLEFADRTIRLEDGMVVDGAPQTEVPMELVASSRLRSSQSLQQ